MSELSDKEDVARKWLLGEIDYPTALYRIQEIQIAYHPCVWLKEMQLKISLELHAENILRKA